MVFDLKQVSRYFTESAIRQEALVRVTNKIDEETRVVIAHSLGSVVAYETLFAPTNHPVRAFITFGSTLGIRSLIFDRLNPRPTGDRGSWPGLDDPIWSNVSDEGDTLTLEKDLTPRFRNRIRNILVHNDSQTHHAVPCLTDRLTGSAVAGGINGR